MAAKLNYYEVQINGVAHVVQLDAEDAERYGDSAKKVSGPLAGPTMEEARAARAAQDLLDPAREPEPETPPKK